MKKIFLVLALLLCLTGCKKEETKIYLPKGEVANVENSGYMYKENGLLSYELNSVAEYDNKIANKDSFLLFVYSPTCTGCKNVSPALKKYVNENKIALYTLDKANLSAKHELTKAGVVTTPYLIIVVEGEIKVVEFIDNVMLDGEGNEKLVNDFMEKYIVWEE